MLGTSPDSKGGMGTVVKGFDRDLMLSRYRFIHVVTHRDASSFGKVAVAISGYLRFCKLLKAKSIDLVHIHSSFGASFTRALPFIRLAVRAGIPIVNHIHAGDWSVFYERASVKKKKLIAETYGSCTKLIALSQEWADLLGTVVPKSKIVVLENFTPIYDGTHVPDRTCKRVLYMGRLEREKGVDEMPEICFQVSRDIPDVKFVLCGDGPLKGWIETEFSKRGLEENLSCLGWIDGKEKLGILKSSSLFLLPSRFEGMPMSVLEAMGLGLPVVATDVGGIPQIVQSGANGVLCAPGDTETMASAIVKILGNEDLYAAMSGKSKSIAESHSIPVYSFELESIYDEVLEAEC